MQNATDSHKRPGRPPVNSASSHYSLANDVLSTNQTSNHFLGTNQRSWMTNKHIGRAPAVTQPNTNTVPEPRGRPGEDVPTATQTSNPVTTVHNTPQFCENPAPELAARSLPSYRFLSRAPSAQPDHDSLFVAEDASDQVDSGLHTPQSNAAPEAEDDATSRGQAVEEHEVVDLTTSQDDSMPAETSVSAEATTPVDSALAEIGAPGSTSEPARLSISTRMNDPAGAPTPSALPVETSRPRDNAFLAENNLLGNHVDVFSPQDLNASRTTEPAVVPDTTLTAPPQGRQPHMLYHNAVNVETIARQPQPAMLTTGMGPASARSGSEAALSPRRPSVPPSTRAPESGHALAVSSTHASPIVATAASPASQTTPLLPVSRSTSTQLLTPAASPLNHYSEQLSRKRSALEGSTMPPPPTRMRTDSSTSPRVTQTLPQSHLSPPYARQPVPSLQQQNTSPQSRRSMPHVLQYASQVPQHYSQALVRSAQSAQQSSVQQHGGSQQNTFEERPSAVVISHTLDRGQAFLGTLTSNLRDMSRHVKISGDKVNLRIQWLQDACQVGDLFFLLLIQLLCTFSLQRNLLMELGIDESCYSGFQKLELFFSENASLPAELIAFLAGWPFSIFSLNANAELRNWVANTRQFLPRLGARWEGFRSNCLHRRYPPTAREVIEELHCPLSTTLPRAIFSSLFGQLYPSADEHFHGAAFGVFLEHQRDSYKTIVHPPNRPAEFGRSAQDDFQSFATKYRAMLLAHGRAPVHVIQPPVPNVQAAPQNIDPSLLRPPPPSTAPPKPVNQISPVAESHGVLDTSLRTSHPNPTIVRQNAGLGVCPQTLDSRQNSNTVQNAQMSGFRAPSSLRVSSGANVAQQNTSQGHAPSPVATRPRALGTSVQSQYQTGSTIGEIQHNFMQTHMTMSPTTTAIQAASSMPGTTPTRSMATLGTAIRYEHEPPANERLLPDMRNPPPLLTHPSPTVEALHQTHLRQPRIVLKSAVASAPSKLYQYMESCVLQPYSFTAATAFFATTFEVLPEIIIRKADTIYDPNLQFQLPIRVLDNTSLLFNLRCAVLNGNSTEIPEATWAASPTYWPAHIFISLNDQHLDIRRKRHHRRDLAIDVTPFIRAGENEVKVSIHGKKQDEGKTYGIAVEVIGLRDHSQVISLPTKIPAADALSAITSAMDTNANDEDDELAVVNDSITLSVTDPFLSGLFKMPVRGKTCKHKEAFDHETFLNSRTSDNNDLLTGAYQWLCPHCGGDARPCNLVIDGFLLDVREELVSTGQEDARAIVVSPDGSWKVKLEPKENSRAGPSRQSSGTPDNKDPRSVSASAEVHRASFLTQSGVSGQTAQAPLQQQGRVIEVIDLDDD